VKNACCTSQYEEATTSVGASKGLLVTTTERRIQSAAWGDEAGHVWCYLLWEVVVSGPKDQDTYISLPLAEARQRVCVTTREVGETVLACSGLRCCSIIRYGIITCIMGFRSKNGSEVRLRLLYQNCEDVWNGNTCMCDGMLAPSNMELVQGFSVNCRSMGRCKHEQGKV
jgi:hypothetical protein